MHNFNLLSQHNDLISSDDIPPNNKPSVPPISESGVPPNEVLSLAFESW